VEQGRPQGLSFGLGVGVKLLEVRLVGNHVLGQRGQFHKLHATTVDVPIRQNFPHLL